MSPSSGVPRACLALAVAAVPLAPLLPLTAAPLPLKVVLLLALAAAGALALAVASLRGARLPALGTPTDAYLLLFALAAGASALAAARPGLAAHACGLLLAQVLLYVLALKALVTPAQVRALFVAVFLSALGVAGLGLAGYTRFLAEGAPEAARSFYLATALFPHSYLGAQFVVMVLAGAAVLALRPGLLRRARLLVALGLVPLAAYVFVVGSRGAWLAGLAGVAVTYRLAGRAGHPTPRPPWRALARRGVLLGGLLALVVVALAVAGPLERSTADAWARVELLLDPRHAGFNFSRLDVWRDSLALTADHLVLGAGPGHFEASLPAYHTGDRSVPHAHNQFVHVLAELGVTGLLCFLLLLRAAGRAVGRGSAFLAADRERAPLFHGAVAALVAGAVYFLWETPLLWAEAGGLSAVLLAVVTRAGCSSRDATTRPVVVAGAALAVSAALLSTTPAVLAHFEATRLAARALDEEHAAAATPGTVGESGDAGTTGPEGDGAAAAREAHLAAAVGLLDRADRAFPHGADLLAWRARLLSELGRADEALAAWRAADERVPGSFDAQSAIGALLLRAGQPEAAIDPLRSAVLAHFGQESASTFARLGLACQRAGRLEASWFCFHSLIADVHFETLQPVLLLDAARVLVRLQRLPLLADRLLKLHALRVPDAQENPEFVELSARVAALRARGPRETGD